MPISELIKRLADIASGYGDNIEVFLPGDFLMEEPQPHVKQAELNQYPLEPGIAYVTLNA